jgi:hypothetical protein
MLYSSGHGHREVELTARDALRLGSALLLGAAIALPVGMMLGGGDAPQQRPAPAAGEDPGMRQVFSPNVRDDPYVRARLREQVEALEAHCDSTGELCAEARAARAELDD